ncbi:hypothetical protein [Chondromyces crocatus]|uniref:hypothetical protein n=1 Tax=Chondromyces crocatus TaxID=52 RepID=UPI0012E25AE1|nr:hypothetical protein [Chondromyces crocatus]
MPYALSIDPLSHGQVMIEENAVFSATGPEERPQRDAYSATQCEHAHEGTAGIGIIEGAIHIHEECPQPFVHRGGTLFQPGDNCQCFA